MIKQKIAQNLLLAALTISILIIYFNTFFYNAFAWYVADILYVFIPIIFTFFCRRSVLGDSVIAVLLWIPAIIIFYATFQGWLTENHMVWEIMNPPQLIFYSYLIGTYLCGRH